MSCSVISSDRFSRIDAVRAAPASFFRSPSWAVALYCAESSRRRCLLSRMFCVSCFRLHVFFSCPLPLFRQRLMCKDVDTAFWKHCVGEFLEEIRSAQPNEGYDHKISTPLVLYRGEDPPTRSSLLYPP